MHIGGIAAMSLATVARGMAMVWIGGTAAYVGAMAWRSEGDVQGNVLLLKASSEYLAVSGGRRVAKAARRGEQSRRALVDAGVVDALVVACAHQAPTVREAAAEALNQVLADTQASIGLDRRRLATCTECAAVARRRAHKVSE